MKKISRIIIITLAPIIGLPLLILIFLSTSGLFLTLIDGQSHFVNDTSENIGILIFVYSDYERSLGTIMGPYSIKSNEKKSIWKAYPECLYIIKSKKSFELPYIEPKPTQEEPLFLLSKVTSGKECPLDLKEWKPKTWWSCKQFGKSIGSCKQM